MPRTPRAILLLAVWLATFFAGPVLPAFARLCGSSAGVSMSAVCPMEPRTATSEVPELQACCCGSSSGSHSRFAAVDTVTFADQSACACSVQQGVPILPDEAAQASLPSLTVALSDVPIVAAIPPLAHLAADAPLPPFAARLRLPQRAPDAGRAPPIA